jgi:hypothetical protein
VEAAPFTFSETHDRKKFIGFLRWKESHGTLGVNEISGEGGIRMPLFAGREITIIRRDISQLIA